MSAAFVYCATCGAVNPLEATTCFACGNPPLNATPHTPPNAGPATSSFTGLLAPHSLLRQRYRLLAQIGKGGFGAVYQAEDTALGNRKVAVKEMSQRGLTPEEVQEATQSFRNEALLLAGLTHPNLPRIYEQFSEGGRWYLVMDFIEGETLEARLNRTPGGRLPVQQVVQLGVQLCRVLDYLHLRQPPIIFRDLKPANIMLTPAGDLFLIDFGIARHFKPGQTRDTVAFGSAGYAAPEQYGKAQTTTQADIYSLGATLHHLLSGHDPSNTPFLFEPLDLAEPEGLEALITQMLEAHPSKRPASMSLLKQDLERMAEELATGRKPPRPSTRAVRPSTSNSRAPLLVYRGHSRRVNTLTWSPDGKMIASGGNDGTIQLWESTSGTELQRVSKAGQVSTLAWSPDGEQLAWVSQRKAVHLWKSQADDFNQLALAQSGFFKGLLALTWSPDGTCLAAGGLGKTVEIWEAKTGKCLLTYRGHQRFMVDSGIYALAWSPDGNRMASASADATLQIWEARTGDLRWTYRGDALGYGGGLAWSPDGHAVASGMEQASVYIWDAATGAKRLILSGHAWTVKAVAWSPDGKYLASGSNDRTVRIWDVTAAKEALVYAAHEAEVNTVAWSPDGTRLASAGDDQTVHIWRAIP